MTAMQWKNYGNLLPGNFDFAYGGMGAMIGCNDDCLRFQELKYRNELF